MKLLSYNIRGFGVGKDSKFGETKRIICSVRPTFLAIQETKLHTVNIQWVQSLWGSGDCEFIQQEMIGKSGGQLLIWDKLDFEAIDIIAMDRVIGIRGKWKATGMIMNIVNIYGPHDDTKKQRLWDSLAYLIGCRDEAWVCCGDFNEVRDQSEWLNCVFVESRARRFNDFIASSNLIDIPLGGRLFTRVSDDGIKYSKIDRFLVNEIFLDLWDNLSAIIMDRTKSDHCPILLKDDDKNFGPKPFKVFDAWLDDVECEKIVTECWLEPVNNGPRMDCRFMNKLKRVKGILKDWSHDKFGNIDKEIETYKGIASNLETKAEHSPLNNSDLETWKKARKTWMEKDRIKTSMIKQKARVRWALEGDENTKFFHALIRNKYNKTRQ
ncbi:uncharacterized protein [Rutidosis leptorrhynchoides]|uniref:uncharacterized protein n=1 Tax=Rutidosis leptorrhynchoides TaxID=125765 RepID=UPI003A98FEA2